MLISTHNRRNKIVYFIYVSLTCHKIEISKEIQRRFIIIEATSISHNISYMVVNIHKKQKISYKIFQDCYYIADKSNQTSIINLYLHRQIRYPTLN